MQIKKSAAKRAERVESGNPLAELEQHFFSKDQPSGFERMAQERFEALALWGLPTGFRSACEPISFWSADNERVLALAFHEPGTSKSAEFGVGFITRDSHSRYRMFKYVPMPTPRAAELAIRGKVGSIALRQSPEFSPLSDYPAGVDLFSDLPKIKKLHPAFIYLRDSLTQSAARELLTELAHWNPDRDGNLVRDFQTTGYSARVWEMYLLFAFRALDFHIDMTRSVPDFCLSRGENEFFIEATTVNSQDTMTSAMGDGPPPDAPDDFWNFIEGEMALKFGSALHSKMQKKYWTADHVRGKPLIFAIADFHAPASMVWSHTGLSVYLYGRSAIVRTDESGRKRGSEKILKGFKKRDTLIKAFFEQPDSEHVSAILFSNAGTISKFNRMGLRAGFGDPFIQLTRHGGLFNPDPESFDAIPFRVDVASPLYSEGWEDGIAMYHNPNALIPIDEALFPEFSHFKIDGGEGIFRTPGPHILFSQTITLDLLGRGLKKKQIKRRKVSRPARHR